MVGRRTLAIAVGIACAAAIVACVDLFHSTDFETKCSADANAPGCSSDAATPIDAAPVELCAPDHTTALARARHVCALLAACETPIGQNRTGACIANALLAYDCAANPNRPPKGDTDTFWRSLTTAKTCTDIDRSVAPAGKQACTGKGPFVGCAGGATAVQNQDSRVQCVQFNGTPGAFERCRAYGQTCFALDTSNNNNAVCVGGQKNTCSQTGCQGTALAICDDAGVDRGLDCLDFGGQACVKTGAMPACKPASSTTCAASSNIKCDVNDIATGCASGFAETVDCKALVGSGSCKDVLDASVGTTPWAACQGSDGCTQDICDGTKKNVLHACVQGKVVDVDCVGEGLGNCDSNVVTLKEGTFTACSHP